MDAKLTKQNFDIGGWFSSCVSIKSQKHCQQTNPTKAVKKIHTKLSLLLLLPLEGYNKSSSSFQIA